MVLCQKNVRVHRKKLKESEAEKLQAEEKRAKEELKQKLAELKQKTDARVKRLEYLESSSKDLGTKLG